MAPKKTFDAAQMVREIRNRHHEQTKDMTTEERVVFYREKAEALHASLDDQQSESST